MENAPESPPSQPRLVSLDVLRGFDMFWILGMEEAAVALGAATDHRWAQFAAEQLDHAKWEGFHFLDLIFPLFVFISGVSLVFSLSRSLEAKGRAATLRKAGLRALILFALGVLMYGGISEGVERIRWLGVLQRIAICGLAGAFAFTFLRTRGIVILTISLLAGYWTVMTFVPVPEWGAGDLREGRNLANWIDFHFLPGRRWDGTHDPEGLLSTLPAIATGLLGVLTGIFVRNGKGTPFSKSGWLIVAGLVLTAAGWAWHAQFPVIKKLWTSSYVLVAAGYSAALLGVLLAIVDGAGWKRWAAPFIWIGMNPITLYLSHSLIRYHDAATWIGGGPVAAAMGAWGNVWLALLVVAECLVLAWFLHRRRIFLKV